MTDGDGVATLVRTFSQSDFDRFADLSGDDNPIHVDPAFSARTRFGRPVAHGVLLITVLQGIIGVLRPGRVLLGQDVRFPAPTFAGDEMAFEVRSQGPAGGREPFHCLVARRSDGEATCMGSLVVAAGPACP